MLPPVADQFVAGETPQSALKHVAELNDHDIGGIVNLLGEYYETEAPVNHDVTTYLELIDDINRKSLDAAISVKPSQLGTGINHAVFRENSFRIVNHAIDNDVFVWFDMEDHTTTDATLRVFEELTESAPDMVGVCLQSNLRRTADDIDTIVTRNGGVRLTKGAYKPPRGIAFTDPDTITTAFTNHLQSLFTRHQGRIAIGTHDQHLIDTAITYHEQYDAPFEIQMLKGVREPTQYELAADYDVWQYIPFGSKWPSYFYRRIRERKENIFLAARALLNR